MGTNNLEKSEIKGISFGIISSAITTLGMMTGLFSATESRAAIISGIITMAIADSLSDSFGMHVSEEAVGKADKKVWKATFYTFASKLFFGMTFLIPLFLLDLKTAIIFNIAYGITAIIIYSWITAKRNKESPVFPIIEHIAMTGFVLLATYGVGYLIRTII